MTISQASFSAQSPRVLKMVSIGLQYTIGLEYY